MYFKLFFGIVSVLLVAVILIQQKNSTLGSMMGGDAGDEIAQTRRGADKFFHRMTIILGVLFVGGGLYSMFVASAGSADIA